MLFDLLSKEKKLLSLPNMVVFFKHLCFIMKVAKNSYDKKIGNQRNGEQYKSSSLCLLQHIEFL